MTEAPKNHRLVYLVAGEPSGDRLGAHLISELKKKAGGAIEFKGVGGPLMAGEGVDSLFPMSDLTVMGAVEVIPRLGLIFRRLSQTAEDIRASGPDMLITIDAPDFNLRLAKRVKGQNTLLVHYVAPSVWAWKPGRAKKMAAYLDHVLTLLPFEPPYFTRHGLDATFVGHPILESGADAGDGPGFRNRHGIAPETKLLCILPGSRMSEAKRLLPVFEEALKLIRAQIPGICLAMPAVEHLADWLRMATKNWDLQPIIFTSDAEKYDAFAAANAALAASGTVGLELMMAGTPHLVGYRMSPISSMLARILVKSKYVHIANIILGEAAVPELLFGECRPDNIAEHIYTLLTDPKAVNAQTEKFTFALKQLRAGDTPPGEAAAGKILDLIQAATPK